MADLDARYFELGRVFRPHAPIDEARLFAGRRDQIADMLDAIFQTGRHAILYGERGVGKTSLAKVFHGFMGDDTEFHVPYVTCDHSDDYSTVWHKLLLPIEVVENRPTLGFTSAIDRNVISLASQLPEECTPGDVVKLLRFLAEADTDVVFVIDEFDVIRNPKITALFADTIKILSDDMVSVTIILVGVADSVNELIEQHASIERACVQIRMPRMSEVELREILDKGFGSMNMSIARNAADHIVSLSQGLPHYTHLLGLGSGRAMIGDERKMVERQDVTAAIGVALEGVQESTLTAYHNAILSTRKTLYPHVLVACALAGVDERGYFAAGDVVGPLSEIMGKPYEIPAFSKHLHDLSQSARGPILQRIGMLKRFRFRFVNPLMQPFVIMHGLKTGLIDEEALTAIRGTAAYRQAQFEI